VTSEKSVRINLARPEFENGRDASAHTIRFHFDCSQFLIDKSARGGSIRVVDSSRRSASKVEKQSLEFTREFRGKGGLFIVVNAAHVSRHELSQSLKVTQLGSTRSLYLVFGSISTTAVFLDLACMEERKALYPT
jgi:hypothetical protein